MLTFHLDPIFKARGIEKPYSFLVKAGISPNTAYKITNGKMRILRLDHVELLCDLLVCEPNDLLIWAPNKGSRPPGNHTLAKLKPITGGKNFYEKLAGTPYRELTEVTKALLPGETEPAV